MSPTCEPLRSASSIVADTARGYHILKIDGYSLTKGIPTGECLDSHPFALGGHRWYVQYYPNGDSSESKDYISIFLRLDGSAAAVVKARHQFRFVSNVPEQQPPTLGEVRSFGSKKGWGRAKFIEREELEKSKHLKDDSFAIRCDIVVLNEFRAQEEKHEAGAATPAFVSVPPSNLHQHLGDLLQTEKGADVFFDVGGQTFAAHRCVLAARSPVFSAELYGTMKESHTESVIKIDDMEAWVFKALLYFVYNDSLPKANKADEKKGKVEEEEKGEGEEGEAEEQEAGEGGGEEEDDEEDVMFQHLLVAADRYNLERLKLICEEKLCRYIDVCTVATILTLAEQHHCQGLKKACFDFLSSPAILRTVMATDGFDHLSRSCPAIMKELIAMLVT